MTGDGDLGGGVGKPAAQAEGNVIKGGVLKSNMIKSKVRLLSGLLVLVLVAAACSSSSSDEADDSAGPDATATQSAEPEETTPETTVPETLTGLELVLDGDPPSTTISTDDIEQTAADIVHWRAQTFVACFEDLDCDLTDFDQTSTRDASEALRTRFQDYINDGVSVAPDARPREQRIVWSRRSETNENAVLVLACARNYFVAIDADGNIIDDSSPVALVLNLVERNNDDRFLITSRTTIETYQPETEGGDECSTFTGDEVPQDTADALLEE